MATSLSDEESIQFRCDRCLQESFKCSAKKPCQNCEEDGQTCTVDGGKVVKGVKRSNRAVRPSAKASANSSAPGLDSSTKPVPESSSSDSVAGSYKTVDSAATLARQNFVKQPNSSRQRRKSSGSRPAPQTMPSYNRETQSALHAMTKGKRPQHEGQEDERIQNNVEKDNDPASTQTQIIDATKDLLSRIRTYHAEHPGSSLAFAELEELLKGPAYVLRKVRTMTSLMMNLPWNMAIEEVNPAPIRRGGKEAADRLVVQVDGQIVRKGGGGADDEDDTSLASQQAAWGSATKSGTERRLHRVHVDDNAWIARVATEKLRLWVDESKEIHEAVWILRDLTEVWKRLHGTEVPKWMLCEA